MRKIKSSISSRCPVPSADRGRVAGERTPERPTCDVKTALIADATSPSSSSKSQRLRTPYCVASLTADSLAIADAGLPTLLCAGGLPPSRTSTSLLLFPSRPPFRIPLISFSLSPSIAILRLKLKKDCDDAPVGLCGPAASPGVLSWRGAEAEVWHFGCFASLLPRCFDMTAARKGWKYKLSMRKCMPTEFKGLSEGR
jgi:hypothetical protein